MAAIQGTTFSRLNDTAHFPRHQQHIECLMYLRHGPVVRSLLRRHPTSETALLLAFCNPRPGNLQFLGKTSRTRRCITSARIASYGLSRSRHVGCVCCGNLRQEPCTNWEQPREAAPPLPE